MRPRKKFNKNDTSAKAKFNNKPKREPKKATTGVYEGIPYDSLEELAFLQWAKELAVAGYIKKLERAPSFLLSDAFTINYAEQLKTKSKPMQQTIMHGHSYTPEFIIEWDKKAYGTIVQSPIGGKKFEALFIAENKVNSTSWITYIEIKPLWDQNNMERLFRVNQKWMLQKHDIYVNLVKCPELFARTFTPKEYLTTPSGKKRLIKWKPKSLYQYLRG